MGVLSERARESPEVKFVRVFDAKLSSTRDNGAAEDQSSADASESERNNERVFSMTWVPDPVVALVRAASELSDQLPITVRPNGENLCQRLVASGEQRISGTLDNALLRLCLPRCFVKGIERIRNLLRIRTAHKFADELHLPASTAAVRYSLGQLHRFDQASLSILSFASCAAERSTNCSPSFEGVHLTLSSTFTLDQAVIIFLKEIVRHPIQP